MEHFNKLDPAEHERLSLLLEEMGEAQQIIGKILRHGYDSFHPDCPQITNRGLLAKELGHVWLAVHLMDDNNDVSLHSIKDQMKLKNLQVGQWLHHQE